MRFAIYFLVILLALSACKRNGKEEKVQDELKTIEDKTIEKEVQVSDSRIVYRVPTPIEFFMFYRNAGGTFNENHLLESADAEKYISTKEKAVAFGMFASNLAYSAVFGQNQHTISYFETGKLLADELGFTEGYGKDLMNRFQSNLDNVDSLYHLTADSYWKVFNFLEDQDKTRLLSYITVAGWIESLYLAFNSIDGYQDGEIIGCLADQQYVIENLDAFIQEVHINETDQDEIFRMVRMLNERYALLYENPDNIMMTKTQFDSLKVVINRSRELLVKR